MMPHPTNTTTIRTDFRAQNAGIQHFHAGPVGRSNDPESNTNDQMVCAARVSPRAAV